MTHQEMEQKYHNVFGTAEGRLVLGNILTEGHFFETLDPDNPVSVAEHNFAKVIAYKAGVFDLLYPQLGLDQTSRPR